MSDDWLTISEASRLAGYHPEHIRELVRDGKLKARKVVIVWLVTRKSLLNYLHEQSQKGEKRGRKPKS
jgi:excisionase family DNA binding protein